MAKNIVEKGEFSSPLLLYNRSTKKALELVATLPAGKAEVVESLELGIPKADVVFTCVANDDAVQDLFKVMFQSYVTGKLFIDCSTVHPDTTELIAQRASEAGADFVAAPIFGTPAMADAGQLIGVLAGPRSSAEKASPWFKGVMAGSVIDLLDEPCRKATMLKVLGNTFVFNMVEQLAEAHVVAEKSGLGTDVLHQFVSYLFPGAYTACSTSMLSGEYHKRAEPFFAIDLARKDATHARSMARSAGTELMALEIADTHFAKVKEHCGKSGDMTGVYGAVRDEAGLKFENEA